MTPPAHKHLKFVLVYLLLHLLIHIYLKSYPVLCIPSTFLSLFPSNTFPDHPPGEKAETQGDREVKAARFNLR